MIRNETQIRQILKDTETIHLFLDTLDQERHRDFLYLFQRTNARLDFVREILAHPDHNYSLGKPVTKEWLERKYLSNPPYDFMETYAGE